MSDSASNHFDVFRCNLTIKPSFSDFALVLVLCFVFFGWFTPEKPTDPNDPGSSPDQPSIGKSLMKLLRQDPELDFCLITRIANKFWSQMLGPRIPLKYPEPRFSNGEGVLKLHNLT